MTDNSSWESFWDLTNPKECALILAEMYKGDIAAAITAMEESAQQAGEDSVQTCNDSRDDDRRFWIAVRAQLTVMQKSAGTKPRD